MGLCSSVAAKKGVVAGLVIAIAAAIALMVLVAGAAPPASAGGCGSTVKSALSGAAINGVTPEGEAVADQSQYLCGGDTILTVQVEDVNLPDGTVLGVSLSFKPLGNITLSRGEGELTVNLGSYAVTRDEVRVNNGDTTILAGRNFS